MRVGLAVAVCGVVLLAGCSGGAFNSLDQAAATGGVAGARLAGVVHGGQQPIVGSHVYLFAANTTGYGGAGIAASSSNASVSLLTAGSGTSLDSSGGATNGDYYVTTDGSGNFSISGDYTCTAGQQVYLYALGGNPGIGANAAIGLMAMLGNCPAAGNFAAATPYVVMNEVSTVAAAYAMAGFATDATHVSSSGTALAQVGIANAFANAGNLVTLSTGAALATTPAGNGAVPQAEINTLGNILAACVNWSPPGTGYSPCATLFFYGGNGLIVPGDTATVAINIAHNPGANVAGLYGLASATPPFAPTLSTQPNDFTVALNFTGGGLNSPDGIAIDAGGDAWVTNTVTPAGSVTELSSTGAVLSGAGGYTASLTAYPDTVAIDNAGNAWVGSQSPPSFVHRFSSSGSILASPDNVLSLTGGSYGMAIDASGNAWSAGGNILSVYTNSATAAFGYTNNLVNGGLSAEPSLSIAIDGSGDAWVANYGGSVTEVSSAGAFLSGSNGYATSGSFYLHAGVAVDQLGNVWIGRYSAAGGEILEMSHAGTVISPAQGYVSGVNFEPCSLSIDGAGNVWALLCTNGYGIAELSSAGSLLTPSGGYAGSKLFSPWQLALDGSGDVWITNNLSVSGNGSVSEFIGLAAPVITPIVAGLPATPTADGSSRLGTRP